MTPIDKDQNDGDWKNWSMFVLKTIEKMETKIDQLEDTVNKNNSEFKTNLVELQTKAGFAGALFGVVTSLVVSIVGGLILYYMTNKEPDKNQQPQQQYQYPQQYPQYPQYPQQQYPQYPQYPQQQYPPNYNNQGNSEVRQPIAPNKN